MRTILLNDDPNSQEILSQLIENYCPRLELIGQFTRPNEARRAIEQLRPELVFIDLELPGSDGFTFLQQFEHVNFQIICISGFDQNARRAFRFGATDYLLKPVQSGELEAAVTRALELNNLTYKRQLETLLQLDSKRICLPMARGGLHVQPICNILYAEADGSCCHVHRLAPYGTLHVVKMLKAVESSLVEAYHFARVHNSFLVNLRHVTDFQEIHGSEVVLTDGQRLPVARSRKKELLELLNHL